MSPLQEAFIVPIALVLLIYVLYLFLHSCLVTPLTKDDFGHATWIYLHGMIESLPDAASNQQLAEVCAHFFYTFEHYPCIECRMHILDYINVTPIPSSSKGALRDFMFTFHNEVNRRLQKSCFSREAYTRQWSNINTQLGTFHCQSCGNYNQNY